MNENNTPILSNVEKKRNNRASEQFFKGAKFFIQKCLEERNNDFKKTHEVISNPKKEKEKDDDKDEKKKSGFGKLLIILGALGGTLYFISKQFDDSIKNVNNSFSKQEDNFKRGHDDFFSGKNEDIKKTDEKWRANGTLLGRTIIDNMKGAFVYGDPKFPMDDMKKSGFVEPILKVVVDVGLYWSMMAAGLEWMADFFGITEPSLVQLHYGVIAQLRGDTDFYFHDTTGKGGISGVEVAAEGYDKIKEIQRKTSILTNLVVSGSEINVQAFNQYIEALNDVQKRIDKNSEEDIYTLGAFQEYLTQSSGRIKALSEVAQHEHIKNTEVVNALHYILPYQYAGTFSQYGDTDKFPWFTKESQLYFVNDMVKYVERYLGTQYPTPEINELKLQWGRIKGYWRWQTTLKFGGREEQYRVKEGARWVTIEIFKFLSFVPLVAEYEIHSARKSVTHLQQIYEDFLVHSENEKTTVYFLQWLNRTQVEVDEKGEMYIKGFISLSEYIKGVKDELISFIDDSKNNYMGFFKGEDDYTILADYNNNDFKNRYNRKINVFYDIVEIQKYIGILRKIARGLSEIQMQSFFNINDNQFEENVDEAGNRLTEYNNGRYVIVDNYYEERAFNNRKVAGVGQKKDLGDYLGKEIQGIISDKRTTHDAIQSLMFSVQDKLDLRIKEERERRIDILKYWEKSLEQYYAKQEIVESTQ